MNTTSRIAGAAAVLLSLGAANKWAKGTLIATRTGTEAVIGTGLVHSTPTTVHVIELGAETGAIGKAAIRPSDEQKALEEGIKSVGQPNQSRDDRKK